MVPRIFQFFRAVIKNKKTKQKQKNKHIVIDDEILW